MKSIKIFAVASAVALLSTTGFTSCNQKNGPDGPGNYNGETVKTEFSISIPEAGKTGDGVLRMPSTTVQKNNRTDFQGISGITLIPFAKTTAIAAGDARLGGSNITLDPVVTDGAASGKKLGTASYATVYEDVDIPLSTSAFLFYGKSSKTGTGFEIGALTPDLDHANPADISFALNPILGETSLFATGSHEVGMLTYLTSIACASDGETTPKKWYEYTPAMDATIAAMFETFVGRSAAPAYLGMHGLSTFEVNRVLSDLYTSLIPVSTPIATGIKNAIKNATYATVDDTTDPTKGVVTLKSPYDNFPAEYNLPDGCIDIAWDAENHVFKQGTYSGMAAPATYTYPAQLWYYGNSLIKTSNKSQKTQYNNSNDWNAILAKHTDATAVNTRTRAVAIVDPIQYGVARFDVTVKLNTATLVDNGEAAIGVATNVTPTDGFKVTAILVGGQKNVGFNFEPLTSGTEYTIYDNVMASTVEATPAEMRAKTTASAVNHTLVLETGTSDVMVAVELLNPADGVDFYGIDEQLIPAGGKFYVVGKLEAASATNAALVAAEKAGHVFAQDFTTTANFTLSDLKKAYSTIPDLRTPQLELGFSVDLSWKAGYTYDDIPIGNF